jgi:hypothetical protein
MRADDEFPKKQRKKPYQSARRLARTRDEWHKRRERKK